MNTKFDVSEIDRCYETRLINKYSKKKRILIIINHVGKKFLFIPYSM